MLLFSFPHSLNSDVLYPGTTKKSGSSKLTQLLFFRLLICHGQKVWAFFSIFGSEVEWWKMEHFGKNRSILAYFSAVRHLLATISIVLDRSWHKQQLGIYEKITLFHFPCLKQRKMKFFAKITLFWTTINFKCVFGSHGCC